MTIKRNTLREAIKIALCIGATTVMSMGAAYAQDATPAAATPDQTKAKNLDTVTVTGSRVRRVETETASPVVVLDRKAIEATGKLTIGDIVNQLPSISGAPVTTSVNNGGGTGAATAELRGLGTVRTLVLIDGHRPGISPIDLNSIPLALVERIEVLTEGSSVIYGSDAIAGVINFIMRKNYNGAEATVNYGATGEDDGNRQGYSFIGGQSGDRGNFTIGAEYNKFAAVSSADRAFSRNALALYSTTGAFIEGSSNTPNDRIHIPLSLQGTGAGQFNCSSVTRIAGDVGTSKSDYRCYNDATDAFNFAPYNNILTPQERVNAFGLGTFDINDNVSAFLQFYYQKQTSQSVVAPETFAPQDDGLTIAANSYYNPFGVAFGQGGTDFNGRFVGVGQRISDFTTNNETLFFGFKGSFGQTWSWDLDFDYNHDQTFQEFVGYVNLSLIAPGFGPSFNNGGTIVCGTPGNIIANCTPINIFNLTDPATNAALKAAQQNAITNTFSIQKEVEFNANGDLFELPAGAVKLAVGGDRIDDYLHGVVDAIATASGPSGNCPIGGGICSTPLAGGFSVNEVYAEGLIPILKNIPGVYSLNLDLGDRYSSYSLFGTSNNRKVAIEYRPFKDLLIRGSASDVFRAPTINNVFAGSASSAESLVSDLCTGFGPANNYGGHVNMCGPARGTVNADVPAGGIQNSVISNQISGIISGAAAAGINLTPEKGHSYDFGFVYDPEFVPGLSTTLDYYRVDLANNITPTGLQAQVIENTCFADDASPFCSLMQRNTNGGLELVHSPVVNLGSLATDGFDASIKYRMDMHQWGTFTYGVDLTHIDNYWVDADPVLRLTSQEAGTYTGASFGNLAKWRGNANLGWSKGDLNVGWTTRWVGSLTVPCGDCEPVGLVPGAMPYSNIHIGNYFDNSVTAGYNIKAYNSRVDIGVDNVFNKQPPEYYQVGINNDTDVNTYDTLGRLFWGRFTVKF